jgi:hypothetical protein
LKAGAGDMWDPGHRFKITTALAMVLSAGCASNAFAQQQTTQQLPLPTGQAQTQSANKQWQITLDSAWNYFSTKETSPTVPGFAKSTLNYAPVGIQFVGIPNDELKVEVGLRTGYMDLRFQNSGGTDTRYSGWTDTSINSTITYYGFNGFQPFASLAANLPTGQSNVSAATMKAAADPDVTQIAGFGEGFNIGPTIGVNVPVTKDLLVTLSAGYTSRGHMQRSGPDIFIAEPGFGAVQDIKPGDLATLTAAIGYQAGRWSLQASSSLSWEDVTKVEGANFYQTGGRFSVSGGVGYAWNDNWSSKVTSSFTHIGKNRYPAAPGAGDFAVMQEFFNTNSDAVGVTLDTTYRIGAFAIGPTASYFYRDHNGYDSDTAQFLPAKSKWTAGGAAQYSITNQISLNARAEHLWMVVGEDPGSVPMLPKFDTAGWIVSIGGKVVF